MPPWSWAKTRRCRRDPTGQIDRSAIGRASARSGPSSRRDRWSLRPADRLPPAPPARGCSRIWKKAIRSRRASRPVARIAREHCRAARRGDRQQFGETTAPLLASARIEPSGEKDVGTLLSRLRQAVRRRGGRSGRRARSSCSSTWSSLPPGSALRRGCGRRRSCARPAQDRARPPAVPGTSRKPDPSAPTTRSSRSSSSTAIFRGEAAKAIWVPSGDHEGESSRNGSGPASPTLLRSCSCSPAESLARSSIATGSSENRTKARREPSGATAARFRHQGEASRRLPL